MQRSHSLNTAAWESQTDKESDDTRWHLQVSEQNGKTAMPKERGEWRGGGGPLESSCIHVVSDMDCHVLPLMAAANFSSQTLVSSGLRVFTVTLLAMQFCMQWN